MSVKNEDPKAQAEKKDAVNAAGNSLVVFGVAIRTNSLTRFEDHSGADLQRFSLADIAVGCALGYVLFRLGDMPWPERHTNLAQLYGKLMMRSSFIDTVPQG